MNLPGIVAGQNRALVLKIVRQSTIKAEAFGYPVVMVALVLRFFGSGEVSSFSYFYGILMLGFHKGISLVTATLSG
jgi:hypothetical protein